MTKCAIALFTGFSQWEKEAIHGHRENSFKRTSEKEQLKSRHSRLSDQTRNDSVIGFYVGGTLA